MHAITISLMGLTLLSCFGSAVVAQTFYSKTVMTDRPLLYWNFDEAEGNALQKMPVEGVTVENDLVTVNGATRVAHSDIASSLLLGRTADFEAGEAPIEPTANYN